MKFMDLKYSLMYKPVYHILWSTILLFFFSCYHDPFDKNSSGIIVKDDKIRFQLNLNSGTYATPSSRTAALEDEIGDNIWVLVFNGNDINNAVFAEVAKADISAEGIFVYLTKSSVKTFVAIITNAPNKFYNPADGIVKNMNASEIQQALTGKNAENAEDILFTQLLEQPVATTVPYISKRLPMSEVVELPGGINVSTSISNSADGKLYLKRIVAKTDVTSTATEFQLMGATVVRTPANGSFICINNINPNAGILTDYLATDATDIICGISPAEWNSQLDGYSTGSSPIYQYESGKTNNTTVIIKAKYNNTEYYYSLAYVDELGNLLDIVRNKHYKFNITSVTGPGYSSYTIAKQSPSSNIHYYVTVTDNFSHDIISNGKYYLGVSNSELVIYGEGNQSDILAFTVMTDASASSGLQQNSISAEGNGLTLISPTQDAPINLSLSPSTLGIIDVKVNLSASFSYGTITVKLGDLIKTIKVIRRSPLTYTGLEPIEGEFVYGIITQRGSQDNWLSLSSDGLTLSDNEINCVAPGTIYIMAPSNISSTTGNKREGGEFYLSRNNEEGRVKFLVSQACLNLGDLEIIPYGYIGAFWKKSQTGERLIRIPHQTGTEGAWTAFVLEGVDFIKLDLENSKDPNIGWKTGAIESNVINMNMASNDAAYQVTGNLNSVSGVLQQNGQIYFRIGLKSIYSPTTANPARYGVILLSYNDNSKFSKIYIRQGEDADYLMRKNDPSELMNLTKRDNVKKVAVYNIVSKNQYTAIGGALQQNHAQIDTRNGLFAEYPTHVGGYLQYANESKQRISYHPFNPLGALSTSIWNTTPKTGGWDNSLIWTYETCPEPWRRPYDGSKSANEAGSSNGNSELRQSLYLHPVSGGTRNNFNAIYGYYADGFFDRRKIVASPTGTPSTAVSVNTTSIAYAGYLFYNPYNNASVFFPLSGRRAAADGRLELAGEYAAYWSGTQYSDANAWVLEFDKNGAIQSQRSKNQAVSIRCVRD